MKQVKIDPLGGNISLQIEFKSLQYVSYSYRIYNEDETEIFHEEEGDSDEDTDLNTRELSEDSDWYLEKKLRVTINVVDPEGEGNDYKVDVTVLQDGEICGKPIAFNGKTEVSDVYKEQWREFKSIDDE